MLAPISPTWFQDVSAADTASHVNSNTLSIDGINSAADDDAGAGANQYDWIVQFDAEALGEVTSPLQTASLLVGSGVEFEVIRGLGLVGQVLVRSSDAPIEAVDAWLASNTHVAGYELDAAHVLQTVPNDSNFSQLWGLNNTGQTGGTADADIDAAEAWDISTGSSSIVVGIIDTGVDYTHPDLAANIWTNPGEIAGNGIDDDGNGFVDDVHGYDFLNNDGDPMDDNSHGTHVAGTIAGAGNNGRGVTGVNWSSSIMGLKFLSSSGSGYISDAVRAVNYATMMRTSYGVNVRVTNNSWGGGGFSSAMQRAIRASNNAGILFVAAAGNSASDNDSSAHYPSNYDVANVISVAATDHNDNLASFSSYGASSVHLAAPGVSIYSTVPGGGYATYSGTSMATPHVAGVAALAWSVNPNASVAEIRSALLGGTDPLASLSGRVATGGRLNALGTLELLGAGGPQGPYVSSLSASPDAVAVGATVTLTAEIAGDPDGAVSGVYFYRDANANGQLDDADPLLDVDTTIIGQQAGVTLDTTGLASGRHTLFARALYGGSQWTTATRGTLFLAPPDDHGNDAATATAVAGRSTVAGAIELGGDVDWFAVEAVAGRTYVFETSLTGLPDSVLALYAQDGATWIGGNDDISWPDNPGSRITWLAEGTGTYYLEVAAYDGVQTGAYTLSVVRQAPPAVDLGVVDFHEIQALDLAGGDSWYSFQTTRQGYLTLEALFQGLPNDVEMKLYDGAFGELATSAAADGGERIDWSVGAGETYYVGLTGSAADVDLRLANLVHQDGASVSVYGTATDDRLDFAAAVWHQVTINGVHYEFDASVVSSIKFNGGAGRDTAVLLGSSGDDTAVLHPSWATLTGPGYRAVVTNTADIIVMGQGGTDVAKLYDSAGDDTFVGATAYARLYGNGFYNQAFAFRYVHAYATGGGTDVAKLYDSAGDDRFVATPESGRLFGDAFYNQAVFFRYVHAYATGGGADVAKLRDSAGDDTFVATPDYGRLYGDGFSNQAVSFRYVHAYATGGGTDVAKLYDSPGNDTFVAKPKQARLFGDGFYNRAVSFRYVHAYATGGGADVAKLYDSARDDTFIARPEYGRLFSDRFYNRAVSFRYVHAYATRGGADVAKLFDSAGDDHLEGSGGRAGLFSEGASTWAYEFARVRAVASQFGSDTKHIASIDYLLETQGPWIDV